MEKDTAQASGFVLSDHPTRAQIFRHYRENVFSWETVRTILTVLFYTFVILTPGYLLSFLSGLV